VPSFPEPMHTMRASITAAVATLGFAVAAWPCLGRAESDREFVFADLEGHLIMRFVGAAETGLTESQMDEVSNAEFSSMVHDRLRADLIFEAEPRDPEWAAGMEPELERHVKHLELELTDVFTECRAESCRVILEHGSHWTVPQHRIVLEAVQESLEAFIADRRELFEPKFMITAYYQEFEVPHVKAFLRRTAHAPK
jgi:hypothetical protein